LGKRGRVRRKRKCGKPLVVEIDHSCPLGGIGKKLRMKQISAHGWNQIGAVRKRRRRGRAEHDRLTRHASQKPAYKFGKARGDFTTRPDRTCCECSDGSGRGQGREITHPGQDHKKWTPHTIPSKPETLQTVYQKQLHNTHTKKNGSQKTERDEEKIILNVKMEGK